MAQVFQTEEYVKVVASDAVGCVEQWTSATEQYLVEFNRDSSTRKWFTEAELTKAKESEQPSHRTANPHSV